ncbi:Fic/DOC family protein [Mycobacterium simiae]|uniref:Fic/DOC family protein n=1 Tax=Mycobacterium simiae TaxID=1784 RepID=UPI00261D5A07|nr:Fic family protein [Mycobacterium simiae]
MDWADYFWPGTTVLRNKRGITDAQVLREVEYKAVTLRTATLDSAPIAKTYDAEHLRALHGWLFQDLYEWAGHYREVPLSKFTEFAVPQRINQCLQHATDLIAATNWRDITTAQFAATMAEVYGWINYAHPFREGNGRSGRAFLDAVATRAGRWLDYGALDPQVWNQRSAFSMPDLDQDRPQHQWLTPVFTAITRGLDVGRRLGPPRQMPERDQGYDLGL